MRQIFVLCFLSPFRVFSGSSHSCLLVAGQTVLFPVSKRFQKIDLTEQNKMRETHKPFKVGSTAAVERRNSRFVAQQLWREQIHV